MKTNYQLLLLVFLLSGFLYGADKPNLVVFPLKEEGVSQQTARIVTERIREQLAKTGRVRVLEREQIEAILETIGRNLDECTEEGCGIELGRQLDAEKVMTGSITRVGRRITIIANYTDVATTVREISTSKDLDDIPEERLVDYVHDIVGVIASKITLAGKLLEIKGDSVIVDIGADAGIEAGAELIVEHQKPILDPYTGELRGYLPETLGRLRVISFAGQELSRCVITSSNSALTPGMRVRLSEESGTVKGKGMYTFLVEPGMLYYSIDGSAPIAIDVKLPGEVKMSLAPGPHRVVFSKPGFRDWIQLINVSPGEKKVIETKFERGLSSREGQEDSGIGILVINSDPPGALVFIDNVERDVTPYQAKQITAGQHTIEITKPNYLPYRETVTIVADEVITIQGKLIPDFAKVEFISRPPGAVLTIDGRQRGVTNYTEPQFSAGSHKLTFTRAMYHPFSTDVRIVAGRDTIVEALLKPAFGSLRVTSIPDGAEVFLDGQAKGVTPMKMDTVLSGKHTLKVQIDLYRDYEQLVEVKDGELAQVHAALSADFATFQIVTTPPGAEVFIEGKEGSLGFTPLIRKIAPGAYQLKIHKDKFITVEETVILQRGDSRLVNHKLEPQTGRLTIFSEPPNATVFIDDKLVGKSPHIEKAFPVGKYQVSIRKDDYITSNQSVEVIYNKEATVDVHLLRVDLERMRIKRNKTVLASTLIPGLGQIKNDNKRGWLYMLGVGLSLGIAIEGQNQYNDSKSAYDDARTRYFNSQGLDQVIYAEMLAARTDMNKYSDQAQGGVGLMAIIWAWNIADAYIWGGGKPMGKQFGLVGSKDGVMATMKLPIKN